MNATKIVPFIAALALAGCGTTGKFVYPAKMTTLFKSTGEATSDKVVAILPFDDYRGDDNSMSGYYLYMIPLYPWGKVQYDRPEAATFFNSIQKYDATPAEDLGKATAVSVRHSRLFKDAFFTMGGEKDRADFVISGRIKNLKYEGKIFSYGLSVLCPYLWVVGAPCGKSTNEITYELEMRNKAGKVVWDYSFDRSSELLQWIYYGMGDDCKAFASVFQDSMNDALVDLASRMNKNPDLFK